MSTHEPTPAFEAAPERPAQAARARVGTVVWGLIVLALAALIIISKLGLVALNGNYVLIGLMIGAGAALVIGGLVSARTRKANGPGPIPGPVPQIPTIGSKQHVTKQPQQGRL